MLMISSYLPNAREKIHLFDVNSSSLKLACGEQVSVLLPENADMDVAIDQITDLAKQQGIIGLDDVIACFY